MCAQVADARLHIQLAVGTNRHDRVEAHRAGSVRTNRDADAANLWPATLAAARLAFLPAKHLNAAIERFLHKRAGRMQASAVGIWRTVDRFALGRVDTADR